MTSAFDRAPPGKRSPNPLRTSTVASVKVAYIGRRYGFTSAQARQLVEAYGYDRHALKAAIRRAAQTKGGLGTKTTLGGSLAGD